MALLWSYLHTRFCYVSVHGKKFAMYRTTSGVPQGSVLGPLLFSIFINHVSAAIKKSSFLIYADDIKIFKRIESSKDCVFLNKNVSLFSKWCSENTLNLNPKKTSVISYSRKTNILYFPHTIDGGPLSIVSLTSP